MGHYDSKEVCKACNSYRCNCEVESKTTHKIGWVVCLLTYKVSENKPYKSGGDFYKYVMTAVFDTKELANEFLFSSMSKEILRLNERQKFIEEKLREF